MSDDDVLALIGRFVEGDVSVLDAAIEEQRKRCDRERAVLARLLEVRRAALTANPAIDLDGPAVTHFDRIAGVLRSHGPLSIEQIGAVADIKRNSVSAVLYRTHAARFEWFRVAGTKAKKWRLANTQTEGRSDAAPLHE